MSVPPRPPAPPHHMQITHHAPTTHNAILITMKDAGNMAIEVCYVMLYDDILCNLDNEPGAYFRKECFNDRLAH